MKNNGGLLGLLSGFFWGLDTVVLGVALSSVLIVSLGNSSSFVTTFLHDSISFLVLFILVLATGKFNEFCKVLFSKSGLTIIFAALLGGPIGMSAYIYAINQIGASLSSSISAIYPVIGMFLAYLFLKERIKFHNVIGIVIAVLAIILMGLSSVGEIDNLLVGIVAIVICAISWGSEAVIIKAALKEDVSSEVALAIRQMTSSLTYGLIIMPFIGYRNLVPIITNSSIMLIIGISAILGTISYLFYYKAIDLLGATQAMGLNITYPAWAFIITYFIDGTFNLMLFILSLFIIIGALLSNDNPKEIFKR